MTDSARPCPTCGHVAGALTVTAQSLAEASRETVARLNKVQRDKGRDEQ